MKYLPLIWAGIWRKKSRAILMLLQIVSAFLLFGLLQGFNSSIKQAIAGTHSDRLYVTSSVSIGDPLPMSLLPRVQAVPGVKAVTPLLQFPGQYQKPGQGIPITAVDVDAFFQMFPDYLVDKGALAAMQRNRTAAIIGTVVAKRFGIKVGDRLTLQSQPRTDGSTTWVFDIVGTYSVPAQEASAGAIIVHYDYVNEARASGRDTAILFIALAAELSRATAIGLAIDNAFANSSYETRTQSEGDLIASQIQRIVDLDFIVGGIIGAVFFGLLLATSALMMQSIRERTPELAVLKTLGFGDRLVMGLILAEAIAFCLFAAGIGLGLASLLLKLASSGGGIGIGLSTRVSASVVATGALFALLLALIGGSIPAWRGLRLQVADALADR
jgi:putative ABC transport system permease protein